MGPIGMPEMVLIFIVALMLFGPKELPKIGKTVAKAISDFKRASNELKDTWQRELTALEQDTHDIRSEIKQETDQISKSTSSYGESYYNQDSSYDYGAYGYPDASTESSTSAAESATTDPGHQIEAGEGAALGDTLGSTEVGSTEVAGTGEVHPPAAPDQAPNVTTAQGTVPTQHPIHPAEPATRDEASSL